MSALSNVEYRIDSNLAAFIEKMGAFADSRDVVDMALWLQCYTFDTIGTLSVRLYPLILRLHRMFTIR